MAEEPIPVTPKGEEDKRGPFLNKYFKATIRMQVSDLHLKAGEPPRIRMRGDLRVLTGGPLTHEQIRDGIFELLTPKQRELVEKGFIDHETAYEAAPNPDELKMALKGIRQQIAGILA